MKMPKPAYRAKGTPRATGKEARNKPNPKDLLLQPRNLFGHVREVTKIGTQRGMQKLLEAERKAKYLKQLKDTGID